MGELEHISSLKAKHAELETALETENNRPLPDPVVIAEIKKHKLRIKDEIARIAEH